MVDLESLIPDIKRLAQEKLAKHRLPGIALGIIRDQDLAWFGGFGLADLDSDRKPDEHTIARVASVTKTFTTTAVLQLRDEGKLHLDDPLVKHIPEFASVKVGFGTVEDVTLRRLLTHHSGLVTESPTPGWDALQFPTREEILGHLKETEIVIPQDSGWKYSNLAFALLGEVVHRVSGEPYTEYVRTQIFEPLGLSSSVFDLTADLKPRFFVGYNPTPFQDFPEQAAYAHLNGLTSAGQLHSTVSDLAKWVSFQFQMDGGKRKGAQVLDGRTLAEIQRPQYMVPDWSSGQCLGWRATRIGDRVYHSHGGGIHGFATQVMFNVSGKTGGIQFINMWPAPGGQELIQEVLEMVLQADQAARRSGPTSLMPTPEHLKQFLGFYRAEPGIGVQVEFRQGDLRLAVPDGAQYSLHAPCVLKATEDEGKWLVEGGRGAGETAVFNFAEDGRVTGYELGAFVFQKQEVVS